METAPVISLAERLRQRREELGMSQAQAARELDVARTAYRLWEMEAAKPAPDRWRIIARWLGISVTTMLLAEELVSESEATVVHLARFDGSRGGLGVDALAQRHDFFAEARELIAHGRTSGDITREQADALSLALERIEEEREAVDSVPWEPAELRKALRADAGAARSARDAIVAVGSGMPEETIQTARLLATELVSNSLRHAPGGKNAPIGLFVAVGRERLRVEVTDGSPTPATLTAPSEAGGYGLTLVDGMASRWGSDRDGPLNLTWFEIDLPAPGALHTP